MTEVPYFIESESDNEEPRIQQRRRMSKTWKFERSFDSENEARDFIKNEVCWSFKFSNETKLGTVKYYRCNKVISRGLQCQSGLKLILDSTCTGVILYR